jgi:conjugative transfer signal peptidase TraF
VLSSAIGSLVASQLVWNFTASLPLGVYWRSADAHVERGDLVAVRVPAGVRALVHDRAYLPDGSFLIKPVVAVAPDVVCVREGVLFINEVPFGPLLPRDSEGRELPQYAGCLALAEGQVFLASPHPWSFDSRTFGIVDVHAIQGTVTPLWTY